MTESTDLDYLALIDAMTEDRAEYKHLICLKPSLRGKTEAARRLHGQAVVESAAAEATGTKPRRKHGQLSPVAAAKEALDAAQAEQDAHTVAFVVVTPTADEQKVAADAERQGPTVYEFEAQRIRLVAGFRRAEKVDGTALPLDAAAYRAALAKLPAEEITRAHTGMIRAGMAPDFS